MKVMNKFYSGSLIVFLSLGNLVFAHTSSRPEELFDQDGNQLICRDATCPPDSCDAVKELVVNFFCPPNALPALLQNEIYLHTYPIVMRSLLDMPSLTASSRGICGSSVSVHAFYDQTSREFFTKNSSILNSYINLADEGIIAGLEQIFDNMNECFSFHEMDFTRMLSLFDPMKLQERRVGLMVGLFHEGKRLYISARAPLYYLEHNFYLSHDEIKNLTNNAADAAFFETEAGQEDMSPVEDLENFFREHLISDRLGFGDLELTALGKVYAGRRTAFYAGVQLHVPTATTFKDGLFGANFNPDAPTPNLNLNLLVDMACNVVEDVDKTNVVLSQIKEDVTNYIVATLDRLSTVLIDRPLGNGGHFGVGPEIAFHHDINSSFSLDGYAVARYYVPHVRNRFFLVQKNLADFDRSFMDVADLEANLDFFSQQLTNTFFPQRARAQVKPGWLFNLRQSLDYHDKHIFGGVGFDFWYQMAEKLGTVTSLTGDTLVISKGIVSYPSYQGKIYSSLGYKGKKGCYDWDAVFTNEFVMFNSGIGRDFTLSLKAGFYF